MRLTFKSKVNVSLKARSKKMVEGGFLKSLKVFDAYPKTLDDFRIKTFVGATSEF